MRIENEKVVFEATERAAEITSFILKENGWEAMWQGNPEFWAGRNPILFPIVGSTFDKIIHLDGAEYKMGNHGLLRAAMFTLESSTENSMTFSYSSNEETKKQYPFDFKVSVTYTLEGAGVVVHYDIENTGEGLMPFSFGLHPAFNCPYNPEKTYEDYKIVFPCEENQDYTVPMKAEKEIPLCARIMAVADVFDAVSEKRCYRDALPLEKCYEIISNGSGKDFDPLIVEVFLDSKEKIEKQYKDISLR